MNRRRILGSVGGLVGVGLAGCTTCGDCFTTYRTLGLAVRRDGWGATSDDASTESRARTANGDSRDAYPIEVRITNELYKTEREPFEGVAVAAYDRHGEQLKRVTVGDVSTENGFTRETRDGGCCGGTFITYEYKWVRFETTRFPKYVVPTATVDQCDPDRDRFSHATLDGGTNYEYHWRECDEPLPFR